MDQNIEREAEVEPTEFVAVKMEPNCDYQEYEEPEPNHDQKDSSEQYSRTRSVIDIIEDDAGTKWYLCNQCPFKSHNRRSLYGHLVIHNKSMFGCPHCYFKTKHKRYLKTHILNQHNEMKWFFCGFCTFKAINKKTLEDHTLDRHTLENMRWFQCDKCTYKTQKRDDFRNHKTVHLTKDNVNIKCEDVSFDTVTIADGPRKSIMSADVYCCSQCSFSTNLKHTLKRHVLCKHVNAEDVEWFGCDQCDYKTKTKNCLRIHKLNKHTPLESIKWFYCDKCSYRGKHKSHLQAHKRKHHVIKTELM